MRVIVLFEKILVPIDGSENAMRALDSAIQIAKNFNGKISLISVCEIEPEAAMDAAAGEVSLRSAAELPSVHGAGVRVASTMNPEAYAQVIKCMREASKSILAEGEKRAKADGLQVETLGREGNVIQAILGEANAGQFNLVIMGSRGLSTVKELTLGSVSNGVLRHSTIPVLVVK